MFLIWYKSISGQWHWQQDQTGCVCGNACLVISKQASIQAQLHLAATPGKRTVLSAVWGGTLCPGACNSVYSNHL